MKVTNVASNRTKIVLSLESGRALVKACNLLEYRVSEYKRDGMAVIFMDSDEWRKICKRRERHAA